MAPEPSNKPAKADSLKEDSLQSLSKDRPWLLPSNRKLRSLTGISLRNLTLSPPHRPRGKTIDDESLPTTLQTSAKLLSLRENNRLEHSRSSVDLKAQKSNDESLDSEHLKSKVSGTFRPAKERLRRRSTLNWTNAPSESRQQHLEEATVHRMADTWFSLHCDGMTEPVYISEMSNRSMNPSFRFFDLNMYGPQVTRREELTVKFWARNHSASQFALLIDLRVNMRSLQYIGKSLENFHHPLPQNCVVFHLLDGIYTSFTDLPLQDNVMLPLTSQRQPQAVQPTSSFDALMRLSNLDDCIQDALATRDRLATQIGKILEEQKSSRETLDQASEAEVRLATTNRSLAECRKQVQGAKARRAELEASLKARRAAMASGQRAEQEARTQFTSSAAALSAAATRSKATKTALAGQIRRICEDLMTIYPIDSIDPKSLSYTIRDIHLPNANSTAPHPDTDPASTSAALGLVAHITQLLSLYLSIPIPYPPTPNGSTSTIYDPISTSMPSTAARTFPLYQTGAVTYRFEYGVFLLNSDIELLMSRQGAKVVDLRHTLPNLKYILTVLTAGKGDLPARKKGDVRALGNGRAFAAPVGKVLDEEGGENGREKTQLAKGSAAA